MSMKRFFLLALGACALAGNTHAETVMQQMGAAMEKQANAMELSAAVAARQEAREEARAAYEAALARRKAAQEQAAIVEAAYKAQDLHNQLRYLEFRASINGGRLPDGDQIPQVANFYDDAITIRAYLHDSGYTDISDAEVTKIHDYMKANHIRHVSQLGK
jgi:hypothetical protein